MGLGVSFRVGLRGDTAVMADLYERLQSAPSVGDTDGWPAVFEDLLSEADDVEPVEPFPAPHGSVFEFGSEEGETEGIVAFTFEAESAQLTYLLEAVALYRSELFSAVAVEWVDEAQQRWWEAVWLYGDLRQEASGEGWLMDADGRRLMRVTTESMLGVESMSWRHGDSPASFPEAMELASTGAWEGADAAAAVRFVMERTPEDERY